MRLQCLLRLLAGFPGLRHGALQGGRLLLQGQQAVLLTFILVDQTRVVGQGVAQPVRRLLGVAQGRI